MGATSVYALPYLELTDAPDIAGATQGLAQAVEDELTRIDAHPQPVQTEDGTTITGFANTSPAPGSPVVGVAFTAPASGKVIVTVSGTVASSLDGNTAQLSYEVRTGSTIGAGSVTLAASFQRGIQTAEAVNPGSPAQVTACNRYLVTGLTAGGSYHVRAMHWMSSAGTGSVFYRHLLVEPVQ